MNIRFIDFQREFMIKDKD